MIWSVPLQWWPRIGPLHVATPLPSSLIRSGRLGTQLLSLRSLPGSIRLHLSNNDGYFTFSGRVMTVSRCLMPARFCQAKRTCMCS